jgi:hypothetical protein
VEEDTEQKQYWDCSEYGLGGQRLVFKKRFNEIKENILKVKSDFKNRKDKKYQYNVYI